MRNFGRFSLNTLWPTQDMHSKQAGRMSEARKTQAITLWGTSVALCSR
jgi:hypothetical protein